MAKRSVTAKAFGVVPRFELVASGAITPGMLCERDSGGTISVHSGAGQPAERLFAFENELEGEAIDTAYASGDRVQANAYRAGDAVHALLADGQAVVIGDEVESNGDGYLKKHTADSAGAVEYPGSIIGVSEEALDMSDSSGADPSSQRFKVTIS